MELKIFWTNFAKKELQEIFNYYKEKVGLGVAKNIAIGIVQETIKLKKHPKIGKVEELLSPSVKEYRSLIYNNYKIIYCINTSNNSIEIYDVFDSRQNSLKIKRSKLQ